MSEYKRPVISVIVITYNQEKLIRRALDSILMQAQHGLKDVIVSDDCSTDGTWNVVLDYAKRYPQYIRPYRNNPNKGIYRNLQDALDYLEDTDLVTLLSGDDAFCDGFFAGTLKVCKDNLLDCQNASFSIYADFVEENPQGKRRVRDQSIVSVCTNALHLKVRGLISNFCTVSSIALYRRYQPIPLDRGVSVAETWFDCQSQMHADMNYYFKCSGLIHYSGIGVSTKMRDTYYLTKMMEASEECFKFQGLTASDRRCIKMHINQYLFRIHKDYRYLLIALFYRITSLHYAEEYKQFARSIIRFPYRCVRFLFRKIKDTL